MSIFTELLIASAMVTAIVTCFTSALYFSTSTYATIGYGDLVLPTGWRMLGAIEGANGVTLLGWSTAFFVAIVARIRMLEDWLAADAA